MPIVLNGATTGSTTLVPTDNITATLTLPSNTGTLLSTANPQSGGVIQVVNATLANTVSTSSSSFVATGLTASITPKFSTSTILIVVSLTSVFVQSNAQAADFTIYRNGSNIAPSGSGLQKNLMQYYCGTGSFQCNLSTSFLDSPSTTSSTAYAIYFAASSGTISFNANGQTSSIQLLEIAA